MLLQIDEEKKIQLIECKSRTLTDTETWYSIIERKALALQLAFSAFRHLLGTGKITVITKLPSFCLIANRKVLPSRLVRTLLESQELDYEIILDKNFKKLNTNEYWIKENFKVAITVYVDGASCNNGKPSCKAAFGVWFGENHPRNSSGLIDPPASNQRAELTAALRALKIAMRNKVDKLRIVTDSMYLVNCQRKLEVEYARLTTLNSDLYHYLVIGKEISEAGTPHLQGFTILKKKSQLWSKNTWSSFAHRKMSWYSCRQQKITYITQQLIFI